jgi:hypothetical protein
LAVLTQANWHAGEPVVVEGVRHLEALAAIKKVTAPSDVVLIYLDVSDAARTARLAAVRPTDALGLAHAEEHSTEVQVKDLLQSTADLVVDAERELDAVVGDIAAWCSKRAEASG